MLVILATYLEVKEAEQKKTPESEELKVISILIPSYLELCCVNPNLIMNGWDLEVQLEYIPTAAHMAQAATQSSLPVPAFWSESRPFAPFVPSCILKTGKTCYLFLALNSSLFLPVFIPSTTPFLRQQTQLLQSYGSPTNHFFLLHHLSASDGSSHSSSTEVSCKYFYAI